MQKAAKTSPCCHHGRRQSVCLRPPRPFSRRSTCPSGWTRRSAARRANRSD